MCAVAEFKVSVVLSRCFCGGAGVLVVSYSSAAMAPVCVHVCVLLCCWVADDNGLSDGRAVPLAEGNARGSGAQGKNRAVV